MSGIAKALCRLRKARGWTQKQFAPAIHVSQAAISSYETSRTEPSIDTMHRMCDLFGVGMDELTGYIKETPR